MQSLRILLVMASFLLFCTDPAAERTGNEASRFIKVEETRFVRDGRPYVFVGSNVWFTGNLGSKGEGGDRSRLIRELDMLASLGLTNLRILGLSEGTAPAFTATPAIQPNPGQYNEEILDGLDFVLSEMRKRDMHAVMYLNNYWEWSGGMATYVSWVKKQKVPHPLLDENATWDEFMRFSGEFIDHQQANVLYRKTIRRLITRKNRYTNERYRDDPTIMAWQLANEPRPYPGEQKERHILDFIHWVDNTAAYIKKLDPNHLVSVGSEGVIGCLQSDLCYTQIHAGPHIDYLTFHLWLFNWGWYDPLDPAKTYSEGEAKALAYIDQHIGFAEKLEKPLVLEEFGLPRDGHAYSPEASTSWRDRLYERLFRLIDEGWIEGSPLSGTNFWAWAGEGRARRPGDAERVWHIGDDYTGDPPQEPQGRNSVFDSDSSTLKLIQNHSERLRALSTH